MPFSSSFRFANGSPGRDPTRRSGLAPGPFEERSLTATHRPGLVLYRTLLRELLAPTLLALGGLSAVVWTKSLLGYSDLIVNRGLGIGLVLSLALLQLVPVLAQLLPFAALLGILVALGRLREDREILALEASGLPAHRLAGPVLLAGFLVAALAAMLQIAVAPGVVHRVQDTLREIVLATPGAAMRAGIAQDFGRRRLEAREVDPGGRLLRGVLLWMPDVGETVYAEQASMHQTDDGAVELELRDGAVLLAPQGEPRELRFERLRTRLERDAIADLGEAANPLAGASAGELRRTAADAESPLLRVRAASELARRHALPFASLVFALVSLPLALGSRRFSRSQGAVVGLILLVAYYGLVQLGNGLARAGTLSSTAAAWLPNGVVLALGAGLFARLARQRFRDDGREGGRASRAARAEPRARALDRMIATVFLELALVLLAALVAAYLLVDVLERLQWFARHGAGLEDALRWYTVRIPLLATRMLPMALLGASALAVSVLSRRGELTAMHACGLSPTRSVAAIIALIVLAMPLQLALDEGLVPHTNRVADEIKEARIKRSTEHGARALWYREGDRILRAETLDASIGHAEGLTVYQLGDDGRPVSRIDARTARHVGDGRWQLEGAVAVRIGEHGPERIPAPDIVVLGAGQPEPLDPTHLDSWTLAREIDALAARGFDVTTHRVDLLHRFVAPLACLLLPLIGLLIAGTGPPFPTPASALLACAAVGVGHQLIVAVATSLGYGKAFGPAIAALLPMLATATLGGALLLRARR